MRNEEIKEVLEAKLTGFKAEIKAGLDTQNYKLDTLIAYQEKQDKGVDKLKDKVHTNTVWRIRMTAMGTAIAAVIGFIFFKLSSVISTIKDLIND